MAKRKSIEIKGFTHQNPIPNATRIGNILVSGVVVGFDPGTRTMPADLDRQLTNMFAHVKEIVEAAGGTTDDIIKLTVWLKDPGDRELLNKHWTKMFPDPHARPSRHSLPLVGGGSNTLVQCDVMAVFG
ncbi:MAG: RidA family protein [Alphaproteobacteria bacterium]|nr:RidA family protein [Alphaproteobacteria bacterium]